MIFIVDYLREENIDLFLQLDRKVYDNRYCVDKETTIRRLHKNPETDITIIKGNKMVGYISLCPVPKETFNEIYKENVTEEEIEAKTIPYKKVGKYYAYLSSIVVDKGDFPLFRGKFLFYYLQNHLKRLRQKGVFIHKIIAKAVSPAGRKTLIRFGFEEKRQDVFIYDCLEQGITFFKEKIVYCLSSLFHLPVIKKSHWGSV